MPFMKAAAFIEMILLKIVIQKRHYLFTIVSTQLYMQEKNLRYVDNYSEPIWACQSLSNLTVNTPANPDLIAVIKSYWPMLHTSRALARLFIEERLCTFRQQQNLKDMIVSPKLIYPSVEKKKSYFLPKNTNCPTTTGKINSASIYGQK